MLPLSPFDIDGWKRGNLREKMRIGALSWADVGFGAPPVAYVFYLLKHYFWLKMWLIFASYGPDASMAEQGWFTLFASPDAMQARLTELSSPNAITRTLIAAHGGLEPPLRSRGSWVRLRPAHRSLLGALSFLRALGHTGDDEAPIPDRPP